MEPGWDAQFSSHADVALPVERRSLSHSVGIHTTQGKPVFLLFGQYERGSRIVRGDDRDAGKGCRKKRMPFGNGKDRD
jgi:hypothetical protein